MDEDGALDEDDVALLAEMVSDTGGKLDNEIDDYGNTAVEAAPLHRVTAATKCVMSPRTKWQR